MNADLSIDSIAIFLLIASLVAIAARKLRLPYTVGLLLAGVAVALSPWKGNIEVTKELIFTVLLPPLVFEAAFLIPWERLKRDLLPLTVLATIGVILSAAVVFFGLTQLLGWDWRAALMFSTLITATDPVAVIAMLKEAKMQGRFPLMLEAESLFNDGTAAALYAVALVGIKGSISPSSALFTFLKIAIGGMICGGVVGLVTTWMIGRTKDHLVEITCTVVAAYGAFLLAEHLHFSGVLATVVAGIISGTVAHRTTLSEKGQEDTETFWEFCTFIINSLLFILMGAKIAQANYLPILSGAAVAIVMVILSRAISVYGIMGAFSRSKYRLDLGSQHLLVWGGLRGALALALALGLPQDLPMRTEVESVTFALVAFSTIVQGMTVKPAMAKLFP